MRAEGSIMYTSGKRLQRFLLHCFELLEERLLLR